MSLPRCCNGKESTYQCRRSGFDLWVGKILWSRKWQPTLLFLPRESHGQRSLMGYSPWGYKELDTTDWARTAQGTWLDDLMYIYIVKWLPKSGELTHASHHKVAWILKISSLGRFQVYNTPLLTIATMLCIWSASPHLLHPSTHQPQFYSLSSAFLSFYRQMRSYSIFLYLPGSSHLA